MKVIADKSFLESLNSEEVGLFNQYFHQNIPCTLLWEIIGDLESKPHNKETSEQRVARLACNISKRSMILTDHQTLCLLELNGYCIPFNSNNEIINARLQTRIIHGKNGKTSKFYEKASILEEILDRLREGNITDEDIRLAKIWKKETSVDFDNESFLESASDLSRKLKMDGSKLSLKALQEKIDKLLASLSIGNPNELYNTILNFAHTIEPLTSEDKNNFLYNWNELESREKRIYPPEILIPYNYWFFRVNLIYYIATANRLVPTSKKDKTHIDILYLLHLPFCDVFISNDSFHKTLVPLFLKQNQKLICGKELKQDIGRINTYIKTLSESEQVKFRYSYYPPKLENSIVCDLKDLYESGWRSDSQKQENLNILKNSPEFAKKLLEQIEKGEIDNITTKLTYTEKQLRKEFSVD